MSHFKLGNCFFADYSLILNKNFSKLHGIQKMAIAICYYSFACTRPKLSCHCRKTAENYRKSKQPKQPENSQNERPLISDLTTTTLQCVLLQLSCICKQRVHSEMDRQEIWGPAVFSLNLNSMLPCRAEQEVQYYLECLLRTPSNIEDGNGKLLLQFRMHPARAQLPLKT